MIITSVAALVINVLVVQIQFNTVSAFSVHSLPVSLSSGKSVCMRNAITTNTATRLPSLTRLNSRRSNYDQDDDFEYARVGRRRQRDRYDDGDKMYDDFGSSSRTRRKRDYLEEDDDDELYDEVDFDDDFDNDEDDEFYDDEDDFDDDEYNDIIPNALLDQIDPDGAIERMPQLLGDPQFYRDVAIVSVLFLLYALNRFGSPLYDIKDVNQIDFSKFYN